MASNGDDSWNFYGYDVDSVTIPYASYTESGGSPQIPLSISGGPVQNFTIDTGSLGLVVPMEDVPTALDYQSGTPGQITYGSSGNGYSGYWITTAVSLTSEDGTPLKDTSGNQMTEQLPVLVVTQSYRDGVKLHGDEGAPTQLGVGFGRPTTDENGVKLTLANNAFLNLPGEAAGAMHPGYILGPTSLTIGLTDANADEGWAFSKLAPVLNGSTGIGGAADWIDPPAVVEVNGQTSAGTALVDTGLNHAELGWPDAPSSASPVPDNTTVKTDLLGIGDNSVSYTYRLGDGQPQTPVRGTSTGHTTFTNTTDTLLNGLDYLYDAEGGYVGFRPDGAGNTGSTFTQELAASGTVSLPGGFQSTLPTVLRGATTLSDTGTAHLNGSFSGEAPLTLAGGGTFTFGDGGNVGGVALVNNTDLEIDGLHGLTGGISIGPTSELILGSPAAANSGGIRFAPATASTDPLAVTVAGVVGGTAAVLNGLDLGVSGFGLGNGIDVTDLSPKTSTNATGQKVTTSYDPITGRLTVLGDGKPITALTLPVGLDGMFSVAADSKGGTTLTLVHGTSDAVRIATRSDVATRVYGVTGAKVTVGIISDSFNAEGGLFQDVADKALPYSVLKTYDSNLDATSGVHTDEGRAMAQLVHDIAPDASLKFATADGSSGGIDQDLAAAINSLVAAGCNIIVDDIGDDPGSFYSLPPATTQAIQDATNHGVTMITSATNRGDVFYEHAVQVAAGKLAGDMSVSNIYNFGTAAAPQFYQKITIQNDYTNYLNLQSLALKGSFTMTAHFFTFQDGDYVPLDIASVASDAGTRYSLNVSSSHTATADIYVAFTTDEDSPDGLFKYTITPASKPPATIDDPNASIGSGSITGHQLDPNEITVAAADYRSTLPGNKLENEDFSSAGPGVLYTAPDGSPYATPVPLAKPDITAPERTSTTVTVPTANLPDGVAGLSAFSGTSAAAPAFAGVAALMLQADPHLTGADIRNLAEDSALAMANRAIAGAGLVQADKAVEYASSHVITQFAGGNTTLLGTSDDDTIVTNSGATTVSGGGGDDTISAGGQSTSVIGGIGTILLTVTSGSVSLSGGTGSVTVTGGNAGGAFAGGSNGHNIMTGHGHATLVGGGGGDQLFGGGGDLLAAATGNTTLIGGLGDTQVDNNGSLSFAGRNATVFGASHSGSDTIVGGADFTAVAGDGQTTVFGGSGNAVVWAGASTLVDVAGSGTGSLIAGSGKGVLWIGARSGAQQILSLDHGGGGALTVVGFRKGFDGFSALGYGSAQPTAVVANGSLTLTMLDHTSVTFIDVSSLT